MSKKAVDDYRPEADYGRGTHDNDDIAYSCRNSLVDRIWVLECVVLKCKVLSESARCKVSLRSCPLKICLLAGLLDFVNCKKQYR